MLVNSDVIVISSIMFFECALSNVSGCAHVFVSGLH